MFPLLFVTEVCLGWLPVADRMNLFPNSRVFTRALHSHQFTLVHSVMLLHFGTDSKRGYVMGNSNSLQQNNVCT